MSESTEQQQQQQQQQHNSQPTLTHSLTHSLNDSECFEQRRGREGGHRAAADCLTDWLLSSFAVLWYLSAHCGCNGVSLNRGLVGV